MRTHEDLVVLQTWSNQTDLVLGLSLIYMALSLILGGKADDWQPQPRSQALLCFLKPYEMQNSFVGQRLKLQAMVCSSALEVPARHADGNRFKHDKFRNIEVQDMISHRKILPEAHFLNHFLDYYMPLQSGQGIEQVHISKHVLSYNKQKNGTHSQSLSHDNSSLSIFAQTSLQSSRKQSFVRPFAVHQPH